MISFFNRRRINRRVYERPTLYRLKRSLLDWLKLSGLVVVLVGLITGSYQFFIQSDFFRLKDVEFTGDLQLGEKDLPIRVAKIPVGKSLFLLNLFEISRNLRRNPEIREIRLGRRFPDGLMVEINRHHAVALLELEGGMERYLVSREGILFRKARGGEASSLPVIHGFEKDQLTRFPNFYRTHVVEAVRALGEFSEAAAGRGMGVVSLHYDVTGGMAFEAADRENRAKRCTLFFGQGDRESKLAAWEDFFDEMRRGEVWYSRLDLHVPGRIFARAEKK